MHQPPRNRQRTVFHRSLLHLPQVPAQPHGDPQLLWRKTAPPRVHLSPYRLAPEEEATLLFYNEFAVSLVKAEVRPDSERSQKEAAMN